MLLSLNTIKAFDNFVVNNIHQLIYDSMERLFLNEKGEGPSYRSSKTVGLYGLYIALSKKNKGPLTNMV